MIVQRFKMNELTLSIAIAIPLIGCGDIGPYHDPPTPTAGKLWRWSAEGATGMNGTVTVPVLDSRGNPVHEDHCLCVNYHALLTAVLSGLTDLGPSSEALLGMMRNATIEECDDRADQMGLITNTCAIAIDANYPPIDLEEGCNANYQAYTSNPNPYGCGPVPDDGESESGGDDAPPLTPLEELNLHVNCSMGTCEVSEALVLWTLDNPEEYMLGNAAGVVMIEMTGGQFGFQFSEVPSGSLAEELGFEEDDIVIEINGQEVGDLDNWPAIVDSLVESNTAVVSYLRSSVEYNLIVTVGE